MAPRFSVLLPVRDRADNVGRAAVSVLAQTFSDLELVVADGGSTDRTLEAVRTVADDRVRVVNLRSDDDGLAQGLDACRGRWLAVIDVDTAARPQWLARCGLLLDRTGADLVFCGGSQHHRDGSRSDVLPTPRSSRPGAFLARTEQFRHDVGSLGPEDLARWVSADSLPRTVRTPETLLDWFDDAPAAPPEDDGQRLRWALEAIDTLSESPIPDVDLLARYATIGGVAAARLRCHSEARALLSLARRVGRGDLKPIARWVVASVPALSNRVWVPDKG